MLFCGGMENILCARCSIEKPETEFWSGDAYCRQCRNEYKAEWLKANPGRAAKTRAEWLKRNPEKKREIERKKKERDKLRFASDPEYAEKVRAKGREKYARKMKAIHGSDWVPNPSVKKTVEERREVNRQKAKRKKAANPERFKARKLLSNAVARGRIVPLPCFMCGEKAEGHHPDYSRPLDVVWLCRAHHQEVHSV